MAIFKVKGDDLYIEGKRVLQAWESWNGWYWFATEKVGEQTSDFGDGKPVRDTIWFGYVQGLEEEWGFFSQIEIERLKPMTWEIKKKDLVYSGRRRY